MSLLSDLAINKKNILAEFAARRKSLKVCLQRLNKCINTILAKRDIKIHKIETRLKDQESIEKKINGSPAKYETLADMTDIVGIRIITYFPEDVDAVARIIREEFEIDEVNSIDKREMDDISFGYSSVHYIASFNPERLALASYRSCQGIKFEIQIRSILQHAWAEIEHDLGYKGPYEIPAAYRRSFARISALLETADLGFERLRSEVNDYAVQIQRDVRNADYRANIDKASLHAYIHNSSLMRSIRTEMLTSYGLDFDYYSSHPDLLSDNEEELIKKLQQYGDITTLQELEDELNAHRSELKNQYGTESGSQEIASKGLPIYALIKILKTSTFHKKVHLGREEK